jgi:hypothetical protein
MLKCVIRLILCVLLFNFAEIFSELCHVKIFISLRLCNNIGFT